MADFDAFDRMSRTLRGTNTLPPGTPMASMAENLRQGSMAAPPPAPPAFDSEVTQRARAAAEARRAPTGVPNGPTQAQVPNGNANLAGQQVGAPNTGSVGGGDRGVLGRAQAAVKTAAGANPGVGQALKSVAGGAGAGLRAVGQMARSPTFAAGAGIFGAV
ncbi:MAG: hypothetical protein RLZZ271_1498, partial [Pseudomonadota bacterium]